MFVTTQPGVLASAAGVLQALGSAMAAGNMAAGYYAISQAMQGTVSDPWHFDQAAKAIGFAIVISDARAPSGASTAGG